MRVRISRQTAFSKNFSGPIARESPPAGSKKGQAGVANGALIHMVKTWECGVGAGGFFVMAEQDEGGRSDLRNRDIQYIRSLCFWRILHAQRCRGQVYWSCDRLGF